MKTQLSFLSGISIICLSLFLSFFNCSTDVDVKTEEVEPLTDVLTLELSFGDEKTITKDEFLLAQPRAIVVNSIGDVIIADEGRIKVFDENGKEKKIFGGIGQGPQDFFVAHAPYLGPTGYLMIVDAYLSGWSPFNNIYRSRSMLSQSYNLFAPDYMFIEKKRFENSLHVKEYCKSRGYTIYCIDKIFAINPTERVYEIALKKESAGSDETNHVEILYENTDNIVPLVHTGLINDPTTSSTKNPLGELHWELLPDRRVVYVDANEDIYNGHTGSLYTIHLITLDGLDVKQIIHRFTPVEYPESMFDLEKFGKLPDEIYKVEKMKVQAYRDKKYYPSIERMKIDRYYAFMFTYNKNDDRGILTDVFDLEAGKYITSVYFHFIPAAIINGYSITLARNEEGFFVIQKYRIDPAVYGK